MRVRVAVLAGTLSVAVLAVLGPSLVAAAGPSEAEPSPVVEPGPIAPPSPVLTPPPLPSLTPIPTPPLPTLSPVPSLPPIPTPTPPLPSLPPIPIPSAQATPKATAKTTPRPKPKATPTPRGDARDFEQPGAPATGQPRPGRPSPGDPDPLRPDEPPAAAVVSDPAGSPGAQTGTAPGPTPRSRADGPFPPGGGSPPERVRMIVAGATVSGIAAVAGWLILGGRRREQRSTGGPRSSGTTDPPAPLADVDVERLLNAPERVRRDRHASMLQGPGPAPLWQAQDDRPRWVRRLDDQNPARPSARRPAPLPDEESTPWLEPETRNADSGDEGVPR